MRIGLLNNLRAGRNDAQVRRLLGFLRRHPDVLHVETTAAHAVPEALGELARQDVDLLVINGGDGTLQYALTEILENHAFNGRVPMIAPLRGGRTNMSASDLGARRDAVRGFAELLEAVERGTLEERISPRQVLRVRYGMGRKTTFGMFFGAGLIARAVERHHELFDHKTADKIQGALSSTLLTAGLLGRWAAGDNGGIMAPDKVHMIVDSRDEQREECFILMASSLHQLFAGMNPFWGEEEAALRFTSIARPATKIGRALPGILRGKPRTWVTEENGYTSRNARKVELRMDCGFTVDGELYPGEPDQWIELSADHTVRFVRT